MAVLAATLTSSVVFFPVMFPVRREPLSVLRARAGRRPALVASYFVAMTVVPLFCARFMKAPAHHHHHPAIHRRQRRRGSGSSATWPDDGPRGRRTDVRRRRRWSGSTAPFSHRFERLCIGTKRASARRAAGPALVVAGWSWDFAAMPVVLSR
jgi:multidrug efflux pump subunit AcrB